MDKVISFIVAILLSHQVVTIVTYVQLRKEDRGISSFPKSKFSETMQLILLGLPMIGNAIYDMTLGLVDHFREKRLCQMLVHRDDEIKRLKEKSIALEKELSIRKKFEDYLYDICSSDWYSKEMARPSIHDFMQYYDVSDDSDD